MKQVREKRLGKLLEIRPWIVNPNNASDQLYGLPFLESSKPTRTPIADHKSIVLVSHIPMTCVFLLFYDVILCHPPTFDPITILPLSVRPTFTPSLIHPYLIFVLFILSYDAMTIRLD